MDEQENFSLFIHHGGYLGKKGGLDFYFKGYVLGLYDLRCKDFDLRKLNTAVKFVGYASWSKLYYKYPRTNHFRPIEGHEQVKEMFRMLESEQLSILRVFVEGGIDDGSGMLQVNCTLDRDERKLVEEDDHIDIGKDDIGVVTQEEMVENVTEEQRVQNLGDISHVSEEQRVENEVEVDIIDLIDVVAEKIKNNGEDGGDDSDNGGDEEEEDEGLADEDLDNDDPEYLEARRNARETKTEEMERPMKDFVQPEYNEQDEPHSEYEDSDGDLNSEESDSDGENVRLIRHKIVYDPRCDHKSLEIVLGMRFQDGWQCRNALTTYSIENGKFVQFRKVNKKQCLAKCGVKSCKWRVYASVVTRDETFVVKTYMGDHECPRQMNNKLLTYKWLAMRYMNKFRRDPLFSISDFRRDVNERWGYDIPRDRLYKARAKAVEMLRGTVDYHYGMLRRYTAELRRVDPEGRFELLLDDDHVFKGLYIGFSALIKGFKASCRPIIGLDGCHLKTYLGGVLLCAIGKDGNNQMFPIAWAAVEVENEECWSWFLKLLMHDMGIGLGDGYSFISDQQKGLENVVMELAPHVEHRNCSRHIYMNWKKEHKGSTLKNIFLAATRSTYEAQLKEHLEEMKQESPAAYEDFMSRDIKKFCKAFLSTSMCSDMIDNNISETFNGWILNARGKHVIHMCEEIRTSLMSRQVKKRNEMMNVNDRICPLIRKELEKDRIKSRKCHAKPNLDNIFEVNHQANKFVVDVNLRTCSCREWSLTGIPCIHALSAIKYLERDPAEYVHEYYTVQKYLKAYEYGLQPINGEKLWPTVDGYVVKPPKLRRQAGRPKKKMIRSAGEKEQRNPYKLPRYGLVMNCRKCGGAGHNKVKCQNMTLPPHPPKPKGKPGRPPKPPSADQGSGSGASGSGASGSGVSRSGGRGGTPVGSGVIFARRGRGGGRGRAAGTFQPPRSARGSTAHAMREMNFARGGGLYTSESTGNVYFSAPGSSEVRVSHNSQGASTSEEPPATRN